MRGEEAALGGDDPDQLAFGLESEDLVGIQEEIFFAGAAYDFSAGFYIGKVFGYLQWLALQRGGSLHRFTKARFIHGFEQVIHGAGFEGFHGVLIECGDDDDHGQAAAFEIPDHFEAAHDGHLEIEEDEIRLEGGDLLEGMAAVFGFADDLDFWKDFEFFAQDSAGDWFVVHD
jgi:hypothetical protein